MMQTLKSFVLLLLISLLLFTSVVAESKSSSKNDKKGEKSSKSSKSSKNSRTKGATDSEEISKSSKIRKSSKTNTVDTDYEEYSYEEYRYDDDEWGEGKKEDKKSKKGGKYKGDKRKGGYEKNKGSKDYKGSKDHKGGKDTKGRKEGDNNKGSKSGSKARSGGGGGYNGGGSTILRINSGGPALTLNGLIWEKDDEFCTGGVDLEDFNAGTIPIRGAGGLTELFYTERADEAGDGFSCSLPAPMDGNYGVVLYFTETYYMTAGQRMFDVIVNGQMGLQNYDIYGEAGWLNTMVTEYVLTSTSNSVVEVQFISNTDAAKVNAIELIQF